MEQYEQDGTSIFEGMDEIGEQQINEVLSQFQNGRRWNTNFKLMAEFTAKYYGLLTDDIYAIQIVRPLDKAQAPIVKIAYNQTQTLERIDDLIAEDRFTMDHAFVREVMMQESRLERTPSWCDYTLQQPLKRRPHPNADTATKDAWVGLKRFDASFWKDMHTRHCIYMATQAMGLKLNPGTSIIVKPDNFKPPRVFQLKEVEMPTFETFYE